MFFKLIPHFITQMFLGKELSLSLQLLDMIRQALHNPKIGDVAKFVYAKLPVKWRKPLGPVTESEFVDMVVAGQTFLSKVQAALQA